MARNPGPLDASGVGSYTIAPGSATFTTYLNGMGREVNVNLDSADTALLLHGIVEVFGADNVRSAIDVITAEAGNQEKRIPQRELEGKE